MKLNPFTKKTGAYLAGIKSQHDDLQSRLQATEEELLAARADYETVRDEDTRLQQVAGRFSLNTTSDASTHWPLVMAASQKVQRLESVLSNLKSQIAPLRSLLDAPGCHETAQIQLQALTTRQAELERELTKAETSTSKLERRIADVQARIAAESQLAAETLIGTDGEFTVPEVLTKLEAQLRLAQAALADLSAKKGAWNQEQETIREELGKAERELQHTRATMAEIDLFEKVTPIMDWFARAAVARKVSHWGSDENTYLIEIPQANLDAARQALGVGTDD